jgi:hypothetical protein
LILNTISL